MRPAYLAAASTIAAALAVEAFPAFVVSTYTGPDGGSWNVAGNWSPFGVPSDGANTYHAIVPSGIGVQMFSSVGVTQLTIGAGGLLTINNDVDPVISGGSVGNDGTISLAAGANSTLLQLNAPEVVLFGSGALVGTNQNAIIVSVGASRRLNNQAGHTIRGSLNLGGGNSFLTNGGLIEATDPDGLTIQVVGSSAQNFSPGALRAGSGSTLAILNSAIDATGGLLIADGGTISLNNSTLTNPFLFQLNGGQISLVGSPSTLQSPSIAAGTTVRASNDNDPVIVGTVTSAGTFLLDAAGNSTLLQLNSDVLLTGTGSLQGTNQNAQVISIGASRRLTNDANHVIGGAMGLGSNNTFLTNHGLIEATDPDGLTIDLAGSIAQNFNPGLLRAGPGSTLTIQGTDIDSAGGAILADQGIVLINSSTIANGLFQQAGGGQIRLAGGSSTLIQPTIDVDTTLTVLNDNDPVLQGTVQNEGLFRLESAGNGTFLQLNTPDVVLQGTGALEGANQNAGIFSVGVVRRLVNAQEHTVRGSLSLGQNVTLLTNSGLIEATDPDGVTIDLTGSTAQNFNPGTLRAGPGSNLAIVGSDFDCAGGQILADGGAVTINSSTILNGFFTQTAGGTITLVGGAPSLIDPEIDLGTTVAVANDVDPVLQGELLNEGVFQLAAAANGTLLQLNTPEVLLSGSGVLQGTNQNAGIFSAGAVRRLVNAAEHTVQGSFSLGLNNTLLTNHGLIEATSAGGATIDLTGSVAQNFNPGTLRAGPGTTLALVGSALDSTDGQILADGGSVTVNSCELTGGSIASSAGGTTTLLGGSSTLRDLAVDAGATVLVANDNDPVLQNTIENNGLISFQAAGNGTILFLNSPIVTLAGSGELRGSNQNAIVQSTGAVRRLVNGPSHVIRGSWSLGANNSELTNEGVIVADSAGGMTIDVNADFQNLGVLLVSDAGSLLIQPGAFTQSGSFLIEDGQSATRVGGAIQQVAGTIQVDGTLGMDGPLNASGGVVAGLGTISTTLLNATGATIAPGGIGTLEVFGPVTFGATAALDVQVAGTDGSGQVDRLASTGVANLAGTLIATRAGAFAPLPTDEFTVLTASSRVGTFASVQSCEPVEVIYGDTFVKVRFPSSSGVEADLNGDGLVNGVDLGLLLSSWGPCLAICCAADFNDDGVIDGADLGFLLARWS